MHISIISLLPELLRSPLEHSILKRARDKKILDVELIDLRSYGLGAYKPVSYTHLDVYKRQIQSRSVHYGTSMVQKQGWHFRSDVYNS